MPRTSPPAVDSDSAPQEDGRLRDGRTTGPLLQEPGVLVVLTGFWFVVGLVSWLAEYAISFGDPEGPITLGRASARWVYAGLWWLASVVGIWLTDTITVWSWRQYRRILFHAVAGAVVSLSWSVSAYYVNLAVIPGWEPQGVGRMINTTSMMTWFFYTSLVGFSHAVIHAREYRTREIEALKAAHRATEAELRALKLQLDPHFLFNALNSISALMHRDVRAANEMLVLVAELLERTLRSAQTQEVTLAEEVQTAELFLEIEKVRFQDRLSVTWDVDPSVLSARVPHMLLQPILDNAVRYGIEAHTGRRRIEISARRIRDRLDIRIRDHGPGFSSSAGNAGLGIGISVTRDRLAKLYGRDHAFDLSDADDGGALVQVSIPYLSRGAASSQEAPYVKADPGIDR